MIGPGNLVSGNTGAGIAIDDASGKVVGNRVGPALGSSTALGNGEGIRVAGGKVDVRNNVVTNSGTAGMRIDGLNTIATLTSNAVSGTGTPLNGIVGGNSPPGVRAAARTLTGTSTRTWLVVDGLPLTGAGTLEAFGNTSCADPEGRVPLQIKSPITGQAVRIMTILGRPDLLGFTVTYTAADGRTSSFSTCATAATLTDTDGDGVPDVVEEALRPGSSSAANVVEIPTDNGDRLELGTSAGTFSGVAMVDDPSPTTHPAGFALPNGLVQFTISGLSAGAAVDVTVVTPGTASPSYWRYGPPTVGAAPSWYKWVFDSASGLGAQRTNFNSGTTFNQGYVLHFRDGAAGDDDGLANSVIRDPGGSGDPNDPDTTPSSTTSTTPSTTTSTTSSTTTSTTSSTTTTSTTTDSTSTTKPTGTTTSTTTTTKPTTTTITKPTTTTTPVPTTSTIPPEPSCRQWWYRGWWSRWVWNRNRWLDHAHCYAPPPKDRGPWWLPQHSDD